MARMINGDKLVENLRLIATCWSISPFVSKEKHNGAVDMLREVEREVKEAPTLTPPNEWISVEERLPENEKDVLISFKRKTIHGKEYFCVGMAFHTDGKTTIDDSNYCWDNDNVDMDYDEEADSYIVPEGWWETVDFSEEFSAVDMPVTHWMPLPAPPDRRPPEGEEDT